MNRLDTWLLGPRRSQSAMYGLEGVPRGFCSEEVAQRDDGASSAPQPAERLVCAVLGGAFRIHFSSIRHNR